MKRFADFLIGSDARLKFEQKAYNIGILLGCAVTLTGIVVDRFTLSTFPAYSVCFLLIWLASYYLTRFKGHYKVVVPVSVALLVSIFVPMNWINNAGIMGAIPYYSSLFIAVVCIVTSGKIRLVLVLGHIVIQALLVLFGGYLDGTYLPDPAYRQLQIDLLIHLTVTTASVAALIVMYSITYRRERARSEDYLQTIGENYRQQLYYMENLEQLVTRLRAERHDFNNHLGIIYGMLEDGEAQEAKEYAATLVGAARAHQNMISLPYSMLRAMINYKLSVASEQGIRLNLSVDVREGLSFSEPDLAIIIGTLLDNAMEACQSAEDKYITFSLSYKPDYLILRVENPVGPDAMLPPRLSGQRKSTKPDPENHGFGLNNVKYLVEKHGGLIEIDLKRNVFKVNIALLAEAGQAA